MKMKIPKYLLFQIFEEMEEIFLLSNRHIFPIKNGNLGEKKKLEKDFSYICVLDHKKRLFTSLHDNVFLILNFKKINFKFLN